MGTVESKELLPKDVENCLKDILARCEREDEYIRSLQIKLWKKAEEFWHGVQFLFWNQSTQDWMTPEQGVMRGGEDTRDSVGPFYDYVINIYKAHGESIISALSQSVPVVEFYPDDADEDQDVVTAITKSKLALIFQKHNKAKLRFIEALHKLYNQGLAFGYRYKKADNKFGVYKVPKFKKEEVTRQDYICPLCGTSLGIAQGEMPRCEQCQADGILGEPQTEENITQVGIEEIPKNREIFEVYGPLNVKIPYYIRKIDETCGYLIHYIDNHFAKLKADFPDFADKITADTRTNQESFARTPSSYLISGSADNTNLTLLKKVWLRPWMIEFLGEEYQSVKIYCQKNFPKGIFFNLVCDQIVQVSDESMDTCWTVCQSGPATHIHTDALGAGLIPIQEMKNQLVNLTIQTIEYGIPSLMADPDVLNFDEFGQQEASPGLVTPAKPRPGRSLGDAFYEQKLATPSKEIEVFAARLDEDAQFVTGDYPSIYGGPSEGKSRTLGEYQQSGNRALARLSLCFEFLKDWWAECNGKSVNAMIEDILHYNEGEKLVIKGDSGFENLVALPEELAGHADRVEPELSDQFPITADQKKALILSLIQMQSPMVDAVISHPSNSKYIVQGIGLPDITIPGEQQRIRALRRIRELLKSGPVKLPDENGEEIELPSLEPEEAIDDEPVQIEVFKSYLASEKGISAHLKNPPGYYNCRAYLNLLQRQLEVKMQAQFEQSPPGNPVSSEGVQ